MPAPSSISWAETPASTTLAGCSTGSAAPTGRSSAAATCMWPPPAAASPRPPTSNQPCDCWKSTATCVGSTLNLPATHRAVADRPHRGSWSTLCHAPQKPQKPQKPRRSRFCGFCGFCGAWPESQMSGDRLAMTESGMAARATFPARGWLSRYPTRMAPAVPGQADIHLPWLLAARSLPWAASEPLSRTGLDTADGRAWTWPSVGQSAGQIPRCDRCRDVGGRGRWRR